MSRLLKLSVLDQSIAAAGRPQDEAIRDTVALAQLCEGLGYSRFWVSEHHNHPSILGTAPEILMAAIAARTDSIRVGSAGVMLPHYSAFKVAEQFRVLDAIAPGRIDLGIGRAPGSDQHTAYALNAHPDLRAERFPAQVSDLISWTSQAPLPANHPFSGIQAYPQSGTRPEIWMLGSSDYGAQLAGHFGLPYSFAHFITDGRGAAEAVQLYRRSFRPSEACPVPQVNLCVWALAAESEEEARFQFRSRARWRIDRNRGGLAPVLPPEKVPDFSAADAAEAETLWQRCFAGSAGQVAAKLRQLAEGLELDEIVLLTWTHDAAPKRRSYELLAREFGLAPRG